MVHHLHSGFQDLFSLRHSLLPHFRTMPEKQLLPLMNSSSISRSSMSSQLLRLQRNQKMEHTYTVCLWRVLVGTTLLIFLTIQTLSNFTLKCLLFGLFQKETAKSQRVEFMNVQFTRCWADQVHYQQLVIQQTIVWCSSYLVQRSRMSGPEQESLFSFL